MNSNENEQPLRLENLKKEVNFHNYRYHVLDDPIISDYEYDNLLKQIVQIESEHPEWITSDSPTQRAGAQPLEKFSKINHPAPILSLANAFDEKGVYAWYERIRKLDDRVEKTDFVAEPKIDGLSVVLHYRNGTFVQGATRGNGEIGEDITENLRTIRSLPLKLPVSPDGPEPPPLIVVRGEAFILLEEFDNLNRELSEKGEKTYQNPRNTAAGSLRQLDPTLTASRPLTLLVYEIVAGDVEFPGSQWDRIQLLSSLGFPVPKTIHCPTLEAAIDAHKELSNKRDKLPYEVDGTVIKINDLTLATDLGIVGKDPRGAIAYKFPALEVTTKLVDIGVNVGRTGVLTPYAKLEPVEVGGVIVKQATLHNFDYIAEKDIRIGDRVTIKRAGDVIPYVIGPIRELRNGEESEFVLPQICPVCEQPVIKISGEVAWYCVNTSCPAQIIRNLEHFVSRGAMDIVGMGIKIVEQLVTSDLVSDVADIYLLEYNDLLGLDGFADKKAENLINSIGETKNRPLGRLINGLGIHGVGEVTANDLTRYYPDLDMLSKTSMEDLEVIEGVGPNIAQAIIDWFNRSSNKLVLSKLKRAGVWPREEISFQTEELRQPLAGLTFVVTGTLSDFTRQEIKDYIQMYGGKVTNSVSKNTNYVVVGENPGSKVSKAESLGVSTIDENRLKALVETI
jgi:DNA ligase (NAD+)